MIEKWDIKNIDGELGVYIQGSMADAKIVQKKLDGFCKEATHTSIPPYSFNVPLTTRDPDTLEKIKVAVEEAAQQSKKTETFVPATLENAANLDENGGEAAQQESASLQYTSFDLNAGEFEVKKLEDETILAPLKEEDDDIPEEATLTDFDPGFLHNEEAKEISLGAEPEKDLNVLTRTGKIDDLNQQGFEQEKENLEKLLKESPGTITNYQHPSFEDILAAKTVLDMYGDDESAKTKTDLKAAAAAPENSSQPSAQDAKFDSILSSMEKTSFNIFDQKIDTVHDLEQQNSNTQEEQEAIDPFDMLMPKSQVQASTPLKQEEKKGFWGKKKETPAPPAAPAANQEPAEQPVAAEQPAQPEPAEVLEAATPAAENISLPKEEQAEQNLKEEAAPAAATQEGPAPEQQQETAVAEQALREEEIPQPAQEPEENPAPAPSAPVIKLEPLSLKTSHNSSFLDGNYQSAPPPKKTQAQELAQHIEKSAPKEEEQDNAVEKIVISKAEDTNFLRTIAGAKTNFQLKDVSGGRIHENLSEVNRDSLVFDETAKNLKEDTVQEEAPFVPVPEVKEEDSPKESAPSQTQIINEVFKEEDNSSPPQEEQQKWPIEEAPKEEVVKENKEEERVEEQVQEPVQEREDLMQDNNLNNEAEQQNQENENIQEAEVTAAPPPPVFQPDMTTPPPPPSFAKEDSFNAPVPPPPAPAPVAAPVPPAPVKQEAEEKKEDYVPPQTPIEPEIPAEPVVEKTFTQAPPPPTMENTSFVTKTMPAPAVPAAAKSFDQEDEEPSPDATSVKTQHSFYGRRKTSPDKANIDHSIELADKEKHNWPLEVPLVPTFTFESMVIGANRFAHATAISVIDNPGNLYNPLVLHGSTGTGKTHFLNAIGYALSKKYGQQNIFMTNGVRFSRGIQRYVVEGKMDKFDELIKNAKAILIDDIHLTAVNEQNKEYISKYLNLFLEQNRQIVITSKYPPESLKKLEELIDFKLDGGWISELKVASGANHAKIVKKMLLDNGIDLTEAEIERFFKGMSLSVISRTIKRAKVLSRVLKSSGKTVPTYSILFEKLLAVSGEDVESAISLKDFSQVTQIPNYGKGEWGKIGFFYPQDNSNMMKWIAYSTAERAKELGIDGSFDLALKSSYNPANIISSAFKIANICDNKKLKGAVILGPSTDVCDPSVRENFYDILTHMLEIMLIRCGIINFENIKSPSTYVKVMAELLR